MKHKHLKNIIKGMFVGILLLAGIIGTQAFAATPSQNVLDNRYLNRQGNSGTVQPGILDIAQFELAPKVQQTLSTLGSTTLLGVTRDIIFRIVGTSIFDNIIAYKDTAIDRLFVGYSTPPSFTSGDPILQIDGSIQIEELADASAADYEDLCTDDFGRLLRCSGVSGGANGACGTANGGTYSSPPSGPILCSVGTASSVTDGGGFADPRYTWTCAPTGVGTTANCSAHYSSTTK